MKIILDRFFRLSELNTDIRTEILAGVTTFMTMAYIIFLQPAVLSGRMFGFDTGMDFNAVMVATCLAAALATLIMGIYAGYPIAQAPGMGENFFFVFSVIPAACALPAVTGGETTGWQVALGVVFISGVIFLALSLAGIREKIVDAISPSMKNAIAVGIGLFIAFIGLLNSGVILKDPSTALKLNTQFMSPDLVVFFVGLFLTATLHVRRVKGSILWGIMGVTFLSIFLKFFLPLWPDPAESGLIQESMLMSRFKLPVIEGNILKCIVDVPPSIFPTLLKMDLKHAVSFAMIPFIIVFLFMDLFDTIGTLIGVSEQAGLIKENRLPRANRVLLSDAVGTVAGACMGTSTVTSFVESTAGVEQGGRTGLTSVMTAALFIIALFFSPVIAMIGSYPPITSPALVVVGAMMFQNVGKIEWKDYSEAFPSFLVIIGIPLFFSISDGLALGFITYPVIKFFSGKKKDVNWLMYFLSAALLVYFIVVRASIL